jgi:hypothetical protein
LRYLAPLFLASGLLCATVMSAAGWSAAYLMRRYGLDVAQVGFYLSIPTGLCGVAGFVGSGWLIDRLQAAGVQQAHYRYMAVSIPLTHVAVILAFGLAGTWQITILFLALMFLVGPINAAAISHLQMCTPPAFRARTIALFMLVFQLFGQVVGMSSSAYISDSLLGGPNDIGLGVTATAIVFGVLATILILVGAKPARLAMARGPTETP